MPDETSMGGQKREFVPTLWTVVLRAKANSREALEQLIRSYWKPIYFFIRRWGTDRDAAKDLCQGFFVDLLEREALKDVSPEKGRFRTFLLTVLKHYLINQAEAARARKRGGGKTPLSLDFTGAENEYTFTPESKETPERVFNRQWALESMARALDALGREMDPTVFAALKPHLAGGPAYAETAGRLGITVTQLNNLIHRTRRRYREILRTEVSGSLTDPRQADEEVRQLLDALQTT
jgi:RNA polymerase sigma-70 factor (ECF subfamily)